MKIVNHLSLVEKSDVLTRGKTGLLKNMMFDQLSEAGFVYGCLEAGEAQKQHFHKTGMDIFIIQSGSGIVLTGDIDRNSLDLTNVERHEIKKGDVYFIGIYQMHAIENSGAEKIEWLNIAPLSHGNEDLYIIN